MTIGAVLLILAVAIGVAVLVASPFLQPQRKAQFSTDQSQSAMLAEKERLIHSIQELEFDHQSGKIPDNLFESQRKLLMVETGAVLEKLRNLAATQSAARTSEAGSAGSEYDQLEELISKRKVLLQQKSKGFCQKCGKAVLETDRYCPKCGTVLVHEEHA